MMVKLLKKQQLLPINKEIINFYTFIPDQAGVGTIRTILPSLFLNSFRYNKTTFSSFYGNQFIRDGNFYKDKTFIKFQRSAEPLQLRMLQEVKDKIQPLCSFKMLYDIDDHLFDIPKTNYAYHYYEVNRPYIEEILKTVDGITVSTHFLKKIMEKYNSNVEVVPNYLLKCLWGNLQDNSHHDGFRILYAGSFNHFASENTEEKMGGDFSKELIDFIKKTTKEITWVMVGGFPQELKTQISNKEIEYHPWQNILNYPQFLNSLQCDLAIAPLEINDFNRAKSDLKILEYSALGLPGIYTEIEPYQKAFCKVSNDNFVDKIQEVINSVDLQREIIRYDSKILESRWMEDNGKYWLNQHLKLCGKRMP